MEVAEQYCSLRTCNNQNNEYKKQEAKHVIHLVRPIKGSLKEIKIKMDTVLILFLHMQ